MSAVECASYYIPYRFSQRADIRLYATLDLVQERTLRAGITSASAYSTSSGMLPSPMRRRSGHNGDETAKYVESCANRRVLREPSSSVCENRRVLCEPSSPARTVESCAKRRVLCGSRRTRRHIHRPISHCGVPIVVENARQSLVDRRALSEVSSRRKRFNGIQASFTCVLRYHLERYVIIIIIIILIEACRDGFCDEGATQLNAKEN